MPPVIEVFDLRRSYKSSTGSFRRKVKTTEALRGVSFEVAEGELFGLLGPNGAGKTTTIKILTTLLLPSSGEARVLGVDVARNAKEVRQRIGYVFGGDRGLYDRLSARDNLGYFADVYRVPAREQSRRIVLVLCGVNVPLADLPQWAQNLSQVLPLTHGVEAARDAVNGASLADTAGLITTEALIGIAYFAFGMVLLRFFEHEGRRTASLETM